MSERKYSISEIDQMRRALEWMRTPIGRGYNGQELRAQVENELRTYMANGTDPEELETALTEHQVREQENWRIGQAQSEALEKMLRPPTSPIA